MSLVFCCCHAASSWMSIILGESVRTELLTSKSISIIGEIVTAKVVHWNRVYPNPIHRQKKKCLYGNSNCFQSLQEHCGSLKLTVCFPPDDLICLATSCMYNLYLQEVCLVHSGEVVELHISWPSMKVGGYEKLLYALYVLTFDSSGVSISGKV